jgi:hypothetical protein
MSCSYPLHLPPRPRAPSRTRPLSTECARNRNDFRGARTTAGHGRDSRPLEPVFSGRAIAPGRRPARCVPIDPTDRRGSTPSGLVRVAAPAALSASPEGVHRLSSSHVRQSGDAASAIFFLPGRDAGASSSATGPSAPGPAHRSRSHPARGSIAIRVPRPFTGPARRAVAARGLCERPTRRPRASSSRSAETRSARGAWARSSAKSTPLSSSDGAFLTVCLCEAIPVGPPFRAEAPPARRVPRRIPHILEGVCAVRFFPPDMSEPNRV